jgi:hypothetical protein
MKKIVYIAGPFRGADRADRGPAGPNQNIKGDRMKNTALSVLILIMTIVL